MPSAVPFFRLKRKIHSGLSSPHPHPLKRGIQLGFPELHGAADFEVGDHSLISKVKSADQSALAALP